MNGDSNRQGDVFQLSDEDVASFQRDGYVHLKGVLSENEIVGIESVYQSFLNGDIPVEGRDFCDMAGGYDRKPEDYSIINVMLPRRYHPEWCGNIFERRAASIAEGLCGPGMEVDYDQLLAKRPHKPDAVFHWHQDMAYWLPTPDMRTATIWLALDDSDRENGCMRFVCGSHLEDNLRPHHPLHDDREQSHTLLTDLDEESENVRYACIKRGDVTVHNERVIHGSGPNVSDRWRRAYVVAFRATETIEDERGRGFTHSHNDKKGVINSVGVEGETRDPSAGM